MEIQLYSWYDHFTLTQKPQFIQWTKEERPLVFYSDVYVMTAVKEKNACALLIEPRSIQPTVYKYIETYPDKFLYIFTHDSRLLNNLPNAKLIYWGGVYEYNDVPKTKDISFCSSNKTMCKEHIDRLNLCRQLEDTIDCMGTYSGGNRVNTYDIYAEYKFSVIFENYIDDYWFSEKICNCFANKCIPIYFGARKINTIFNEAGIFECRGEIDIKRAIDFILTTGTDREYNDRIEVINDNYERVKKFTCFEDTFYHMYRELLEDIENG